MYRDGSVLLTHGGVEMGQGLHTKMIQVTSEASDVLGVMLPLQMEHKNLSFFCGMSYLQARCFVPLYN